MVIMNSSNTVNYFKEKKILEEEEKALKEILAKFQDQLHRLKIEELALLSHMKMQEETRISAESSSANLSRMSAQSTAIFKPYAPSEAGSSSTITSVVPVGVRAVEMVRNSGTSLEKSLDDTLKEELDLFVSGDQLAYEQELGNEEEEEEEEEEEMDEEAKERHSHLCSYMDTLS